MTPEQKPGRSRQDYGTPWEFIRAVEARFGALAWDLACDLENKKAPCFIHENSLTKPWPTKGNAWLNPPFADIAPWAERCATHRSLTFVETRIFLLTPASVGSNWFAQYVHGKALVLALSPRLTFEGCTAPYPKDCILSCYGEPPGFDVWRWR